MREPTLFAMPESLSPRLKWMAKHGIRTHHAPDCELKWIAWMPDNHFHEPDPKNPKFKYPVPKDYESCGSGINEEEALEGLCVIYELPHWSEESR